MQDAVINASRQLGRLVTKELVYTHCQPSLDKDGCIMDIISSVEHLFNFTKDMRTFSRIIGGIEMNLLGCEDGKVRIVCTTLTKKQEKKSVENHAFVHRASPIPDEKRKHIGVFIDNRSNEPILLIQEKDLNSIETARNVYVKYFEGDKKMDVRIQTIFKVEIK